ncbi:hypothetical protein N781_04475 [Pontibacillus halophilus JSM 076056 = DSM 19796]|uniref:Thiamine-binding protein domain-containing protein n=1 Tax=Pontibacillus halophilus JSM 076056 = DSM 19796 TaxID=1385510 RepID=A0A0A5I672_9BACI|nr:thiamine-binding protein [Pontibacillus halophilus]KGX91327.1 hypothetical protein N781_04475 [Pontibacillus halophilus JSM 076056 = DSM 19796]
MSNVNVGFQVIPRADGKDIHALVDEAIKVVHESGVTYEVGPLETVMEGEMDELLEIVKKAQQACIDRGASDVMTYIKVQNSPGNDVSMNEKVSKYR